MSTVEDRRCGTCRHFHGGKGDEDFCLEGCEDPSWSRWEPVRIPLPDAELLACEDILLLDRGELERLISLLRERLDFAEAQEVLARNEIEIKAERKARAKGAR